MLRCRCRSAAHLLRHEHWIDELIESVTKSRDARCDLVEVHLQRKRRRRAQSQARRARADHQTRRAEATSRCAAAAAPCAQMPVHCTLRCAPHHTASPSHAPSRVEWRVRSDTDGNGIAAPLSVAHCSRAAAAAILPLSAAVDCLTCSCCPFLLMTYMIVCVCWCSDGGVVDVDPSVSLSVCLSVWLVGERELEPIKGAKTKTNGTHKPTGSRNNTQTQQQQYSIVTAHTIKHTHYIAAVQVSARDRQGCDRHANSKVCSIF